MPWRLCGSDLGSRAYIRECRSIHYQFCRLHRVASPAGKRGTQQDQCKGCSAPDADHARSHVAKQPGHEEGAQPPQLALSLQPSSQINGAGNPAQVGRSQSALIANPDLLQQGRHATQPQGSWRCAPPGARPPPQRSCCSCPRRWPPPWLEPRGCPSQAPTQHRRAPDLPHEAAAHALLTC